MLRTSAAVGTEFLANCPFIVLIIVSKAIIIIAGTYKGDRNEH